MSEATESNTGQSAPTPDNAADQKPDPVKTGATDAPMALNELSERAAKLPEKPDNVTPIGFDIGKLPKSRMKLGEQRFTQYRCNFMPGTTADDLERPAFWVQCYKFLEEGTMIDGKTDDNKTYFRAIVIATGHQEAYVKVLEEADLSLEFDVSEISSEYYPKFAGQQDKWTVRRTVDDAVIRTNLPDQTAAEKWIRSRAQATRR